MNTDQAHQVRRAAGGHHYGAIVRTKRRAEGLTLAQLGQRAGYSAAQVSRFERGLIPLTDVRVLRRFAAALALPPQIFGLLPDSARTGDAPIDSSAVTLGSGQPRVSLEARCEDGEDPVRRRELLTGAAGLTAAGALGFHATARASISGDPASGLADLLYRPNGAESAPVPLPTLRTATIRARGLFQAARYERLAADLPRLIASATATRDHADGDDRLLAEALLADAYIAAGNFMIKLNDDQLAWAMADRAIQSAEGSGDALALADARRGIATVMRRTGHAGAARRLLIEAADDVKSGGEATDEQVSMYGTLLQVAAYTTAVDGDRGGASELIVEARTAANRLGRDVNHRHLAFGPTNVALYQLSIAQALGDNGAAIAHARTVRPAAIPTAERRGRYWIDVARAWHQWGKPERCYQALRAAERAAPAEVRYRPPVRRMTTDLVHTTRRGALPGLHEFAGRVGVPAMTK